MNEWDNLPLTEKHARKKFKAYIHEIEAVAKTFQKKEVQLVRAPRITYTLEGEVPAKVLKRLNTIVALIEKLEFVGRPRVEIKRL